MVVNHLCALGIASVLGLAQGERSPGVIAGRERDLSVGFGQAGSRPVKTSWQQCELRKDSPPVEESRQTAVLEP